MCGQALEGSGCSLIARSRTELGDAMRVIFRLVAGFVLGYAVAFVLCRGVGKDTRQKDEGTEPGAWIPDVGEEAELGTVIGKVCRERDQAVFVDFLRKAVVTDPNGKVSPKSIWNAWTGQTPDKAVDYSKEIGGIRFREVQGIFIVVFDAEERLHARLDGGIQRVWRGYRLEVPDSWCVIEDSSEV